MSAAGGGRDPVLSDATMICNFCQAGLGIARSLLTYGGVELLVVGEVLDELRDRAERENIAALATFAAEWPAERVRVLDAELTAKVLAAAKVRQMPGDHELSDIGEIATVFYANQRRTDGESLEILTDDRFGKELARDRGFTPLTTPGLVVEMVCGDALAYNDGARVWRQAVPRPGWSDYEARIRAGCVD